MKTGFLIVNYNDYPSTKKLIDNIKGYSNIDLILVVDNKSSDDSVKKLKRLNIDKLKLICCEENKGYSNAINTGSKYLIDNLGKCNIIVSNADIIINNEDDIGRLIKLLNKKEIGVVAPTIFERGKLNRGWKQVSPLMECMLNIPFIHRWFRKRFVYYKESHYNSDTSIIDIASGCFFLIKSDTMEKINYLDDNVFLYYEENILAKKLKKIGKKIIVDNNTVIIHNHSVTIDKNVKKIKKYKIQKKSQYYFEKEYNDANIMECFLLRFTYYIGLVVLSIYYFMKDLIS